MALVYLTRLGLEMTSTAHSRYTRQLYTGHSRYTGQFGFHINCPVYGECAVLVISKPRRVK